MVIMFIYLFILFSFLFFLLVILCFICDMPNEKVVELLIYVVEI